VACLVRGEKGGELHFVGRVQVYLVDPRIAVTDGKKGTAPEIAELSQGYETYNERGELEGPYSVNGEQGIYRVGSRIGLWKTFDRSFGDPRRDYLSRVTRYNGKGEVLEDYRVTPEGSYALEISDANGTRVFDWETGRIKSWTTPTEKKEYLGVNGTLSSHRTKNEQKEYDPLNGQLTRHVAWDGKWVTEKKFDSRTGFMTERNACLTQAEPHALLIGCEGYRANLFEKFDAQTGKLISRKNRDAKTQEWFDAITGNLRCTRISTQEAFGSDCRTEYGY
jgi:hypothetical protein